MKICTKCKIEKDISEFGNLKSSKDGHKGACKKCHVLETLEWKKKNIEKCKDAKKKFYYNNLEREQQRCKDWKKNNPEKAKLSSDNWRANNLDWQNKKYSNNIQFKLKRVLSARIKQAIKSQSGIKALKTNELLNSTGKEIYNYLESLFQDGMTWQNHGSGPGTWQIDHIIPLSSFDLTDLEQQKNACNYKNLQPLWWEDNMAKGSKLDWNSNDNYKWSELNV